ncbi:hypothetical protein HOY82DRAFT_574383 [Tuber indicum]|nr:hypothetical protein HOY82DRAFT_574383 [Tuber indicum]
MESYDPTRIKMEKKAGRISTGYCNCGARAPGLCECFIGLCQPLGASMYGKPDGPPLSSKMGCPFHHPNRCTKTYVTAYENDLRKVFVKCPRHALGRFLSTFGVWWGMKTIWGAHFGLPSGVQYGLFGEGRRRSLLGLFCRGWQRWRGTSIG